MKELLRARPEQKAEDIMVREVHKVHPYTHQERAAYLALTYSIKAIPVVEKDGKFLGVVASDALLKVMHHEASEDLYRLAGVRHRESINDNVLTLSIFRSIRHRLPWLFFGPSRGLLAAGVISFEVILRQKFSARAFIPLIVYMSDAVGTQLEAFIIRDFALIGKLPIRSYISRHFAVVTAMACILSGSVWLGSYIFYGDMKVSAVIAFALFLATESSLVTGLFIPYGFRKLTLDPANASGPIATIMQDLFSVTIYLLIATWLL